MAIDDVFYLGARRKNDTTQAHVQKNWGWYLLLGALLAVVGALAISSSGLTTFLAVRILGWSLLVAGAIEMGGAFYHDRWRGFSLALVAGILYVVIGTAVVTNPARSAMALTLLVAVFLVVQGLLRIVLSLSHRDPGWAWTLFHGVVSLALGAVVWTGWPVSGSWVLGLFVGVEVLLTGISLAMLAITARREAGPPAERWPRGAEPAGT